jgi:hypothetical protein
LNWLSGIQGLPPFFKGFLMEFTETQRAQLEQYLATHHIPSGLGTKEEACSIAAINLAISGDLTDEIPGCMSLVIGKWIIQVQDKMPDSIRNSAEWKALLPLAAGTGRELEKERLALTLDWMWGCLATLQPLADKNGFGSEWQAMILQKTNADTAADTAAAAVYSAAADAAADAAYSAYSAARAAYSAADAADAAARAAYSAAYAAVATADATQYWASANPCALLQRLIKATAS